jgi:hypothetical protein
MPHTILKQSEQMAFLAAMSSQEGQLPQGMTRGVNGAPVYTADGIGDPRVALYTSLVRGATGKQIGELIGKVYGAEGPSHIEKLIDYWLIAFQARDVRGGKGERAIFLDLFKQYARWFGRTHVNYVLPLVPEYGCWRDIFELMKEPSLQKACLRLIVKQFREDRAALKAGKGFSLLAKWLPRVRSATFSGQATLIAAALYSNIPSKEVRQRLYRKQLAEMNAALKTVEVPMCEGRWQTIDPGKVSGKALKLYRKAFLNQKLEGGKQRSGRADRVICAEHFKDHLEKVVSGKATVKGAKTVFPHEIVRAVQRQSAGDEEALLEAQWSAIRADVQAAGKMGSCVPMADFSGSMTGVPMEVSLALGILLSEVNHAAFRGGLMTFDARPRWLQFEEKMSLREKIRKAHEQPFGLNTNFEAALDMVLRRLVQYRVPRGEEPENIVVFTDMGFDDAAKVGDGAWETLVEKFQRRFAAAGGWKMPRIVIWNLRATYQDYHAKVDRAGVLMLSGWSPSAMKILTDGFSVQTPYEGMRAILDDVRYNCVREALAPVVEEWRKIDEENARRDEEFKARVAAASAAKST